MSRAQLTSTVEQNTGGAVPPIVAGKNIVINGGFDIWQRGTSSSSGGYVTADRWFATGGSFTVSRQTTGAPNGSQYCLRVAYTGASSACNMQQYIETSNVSQFWGKTVTASILARRNSGFSSDLNLRIDKSATVDAGSGATWTTLANVGVTAATLPTGTTSADWYKLSVTFTVPNDATANSLRIYSAESSAGTTGNYYEIGQCQLEIGSVATPFSRAGGTLSGELQACQRYYQVVGAGFSGFNESASYMAFAGTLAVPMRTTPTLGLSSTALSWFNYGTGTVAVVISQIWGTYVSASSGFAIELQIASGNTSTAKMALQMTNNYTASAEL